MNNQEIRDIATERLNSAFRQKLLRGLNSIHVLANDSGVYGRFSNHCIIADVNASSGETTTHILTLGGNLISAQKYVKNRFYLKHLERISRKIYSTTRSFVNEYNLHPHYVLFHVVFYEADVIVTQLPTLNGIQLLDCNNFPISYQELIDNESTSYLAGIQAATATGFFTK